ncbi:hypothetical protein ACWEV4_35645, partial [Streptomyces sp. NPDC003860]
VPVGVRRPEPSGADGDIESGAGRLRGDSDRAAMVKQGFKAKLQEFLPGTRHRPDRPGAGPDDSMGAA